MPGGDTKKERKRERERQTNERERMEGSVWGVGRNVQGTEGSITQLVYIQGVPCEKGERQQEKSVTNVQIIFA